MIKIEEFKGEFPFEQAVQFGKAQWITNAREKAWEHFKQIGFPNKNTEFWKYTSVDKLLKGYFAFGRTDLPKLNVVERLKLLSFDVENAEIVVFVNGFFARKLSKIGTLPNGAVLTSILEMNESDADQNFGKILNYENRAFVALNTVYFTDGFFLKVPEGKILSKPIHVVYVTTDGTHNCQAHVRNLISMGKSSSAFVIEHYFSENLEQYFSGVVTEVSLANDSVLKHTKIQQESENAFHFGTLSAKQEEGSRFVSNLFSVGGGLTRNEIETTLSQKRAECVLEGLYLAKDKQHVDTRTFIDHLSPNCNSTEVFKGVIDGQATGVFDGRILVRENAQKTDARQSNKNLLLTKEAKIYSKPQLQIYADDVKCSHGSSTGQIDDEALFYLQSRGISRDEAKKVLVYAFAGEMVEKIEDNYLKPALKKMVDNWMEVS